MSKIIKETTSSITLRKGDRPLRVLFAASEVFPFIKTGGLADAAGFLPAALHKLGIDVRIILPAYQPILDQGHSFAPACSSGTTLENNVRLLQTRLPHSNVIVYLVDAPGLFDRSGGPYQDAQGNDWPDNARRFGLFSRAITGICLGRTDLQWQPDVLHCNDWHTGLAPALLSAEPERPATVFSIHNLAYQGVFPRAAFESLGLPLNLSTGDALEFYGQLSFIKGGLVFADQLVTVSPTYAKEIMTPAEGKGLDGLLRSRRDHLTGILNGVDYDCWDPRSDTLVYSNYGTGNAGEGKSINKKKLQHDHNLTVDNKAMLFVQIGRLTEQKGIDLTLSILPELLKDENRQLVILGKGDPHYEQALHQALNDYPHQFAICTDHDEKFAHRLMAAADVLLMPSRFEPCGLTQLYGFRYGTLPIVYSTGGLIDTVADANETNLKNGNATGFHFSSYTRAAYLAAVNRTIDMFNSSDRIWDNMTTTAMRQEFNWLNPAIQYIDVYHAALRSRMGDRI